MGMFVVDVTIVLLSAVGVVFVAVTFSFPDKMREA